MSHSFGSRANVSQVRHRYAHKHYGPAKSFIWWLNPGQSQRAEFQVWKKLTAAYGFEEAIRKKPNRNHSLVCPESKPQARYTEMTHCSVANCLQSASKLCGCTSSWFCETHVIRHLEEPQLHTLIDADQPFDYQLLEESSEYSPRGGFTNTPSPSQSPTDHSSEFCVRIPLKRLPEQQLEGNSLKCTLEVRTLVNQLEQLTYEANQQLQAADFKAAAQLYTECVQIQAHMPVDASFGRLLTLQGGALFNARDYVRAARAYQQSSEIYAMYGLKKQQSWVQYNLGLSWYYAKDNRDAIAAYQHSFSIHPGNKSEQILLLYNLGRSYCKLGSYSAAIHAFNESLNLQKQLGFLRQVPDTLQCLARTLESSRLYEKAARLYATSVQLYSGLNLTGKLPAPPLLILWTNTGSCVKLLCKAWRYVTNQNKFILILARLATRLHCPAEAAAYLEQVELPKDSGEAQAKALNKLGLEFAIASRPARATGLLYKSASVSQKHKLLPLLAETLVHEAALIKDRNNFLSIKLYRKATRLYNKLGCHTDFLETSNSYGLSLLHDYNFKAAEEVFSEAISRSKQLRRSSLTAILYKSQSMMLKVQGDTKTALTVAQQAARLYKQLGLKQCQAKALLVQGEWLESLNKHEEANQKIVEASRVYKSIGSYKISSLLRLGEGLKCIGNYEEAIWLYSEASNLLRQPTLKHRLAVTLIDLGTCYQKTQRHQQAIVTLQEAVFLYRQVSPQQRVAITLSKVAKALLLGSGDEAGALKYYKEAIVLCRQLNLRHLLASNLMKWAVIKLHRPNAYVKAMNALEEAVSIYRRLGLREKVANGLSRFADNLRENSHEQAVDAYEEAVSLYKALGLKLQAAQTLCSQGRILLKRWKVLEAIEAFKEAKTLYNQLKLKPELAETLEELASVLEIKKRPSQAAAAYQQAKHIYTDLGRTDKAIEMLEKIGNSCAARRRYLQAIAAYSELSNSYRQFCLKEELAKTLTKVAGVCLKSGNEHAAVKPYQEAIGIYRELKSQETLAVDLEALGNTYARIHRYEEAANTFQETCDLLRRLHKQQDLARIYGNLGCAFKNWGKPQQAIGAFEEANRLFTQVGQTSSFNELLIDFADSCMEMKLYDKAIALYNQKLYTNLNRRKSLLCLGIALERTGQMNESIQKYRDVVRESRRPFMKRQLAEGLLYLGIALDRNEQYDEALTVFEERAKIRY